MLVWRLIYIFLGSKIRRFHLILITNLFETNCAISLRLLYPNLDKGVHLKPHNFIFMCSNLLKTSWRCFLSEHAFGRACARQPSYFPGGGARWSPVLAFFEHELRRTSCTMIILHACTMIMAHARTLIVLLHARTMIIVHAFTMIIVHSL